MAKSSKEKINIESVLSDIRKGKFAPIYLFYGEETFFIDECVHALIENVIDPAFREFNFDLLHAGDVDGRKVLSVASSFPMMAERRLVIVKDFDKLSDKDILEAYVEKPLNSTILVLISSSVDMRKKPYPTLKKYALCVECVQLRDYQMLPWIEKYVRNMNYAIESDAAALLQAQVGTSLQETVNELEKVFLYIGERKSISIRDVEYVVGVSREFTVFELANMIGEKNNNRAMEICERLITYGESPVAIVAALTSHWLKLWKVHDALRQRKTENEIASSAGVYPYFLKQYIGHCRKHSMQEVENAFLILAETDLILKSSSEDAHTALISAITRIINGILVKEESTTL